MPRDAETVTDIVLACHRVVEFTADMTRDVFMGDARTQSAVIHQLLIIGEGAGRLSEAFRTRHDRIPWHEIRGMRNHLIHVYDDVDLHEVWRTLERDVPALLEYLESVKGDL